MKFEEEDALDPRIIGQGYGKFVNGEMIAMTKEEWEAEMKNESKEDIKNATP